MQQHQEYPKAMKHPAFRPAIISQGRAAGGGPINPNQAGQPARFPDVYVSNADQEAEYAAKGYVPVGKSDPEAYRRQITGNDSKPDSSFMLYPRWLYRKKDDGELDTQLVNNKDEEAKLGKGWHPTPDAARATPETVKAVKEDAGAVEQNALAPKQPAASPEETPKPGRKPKAAKATKKKR